MFSLATGQESLWGTFNTSFEYGAYPLILIYFITIDWLLVPFHLLSFWQTVKMAQNEVRLLNLKKKELVDKENPSYILE